MAVSQSTKHHPSSDLLCQYSAGTVSSGQALCIAVHLEFCSQCRIAHQRNNRVGAQLFESNPASIIDDNVKQSLLAQLDRLGDPISAAEEFTVEQHSKNVVTDTLGNTANRNSVPRSLHKLVPQGFSRLSWKMISISARNVSLFKDETGIDVGLLKLKPGGKVARHHHLGEEYTIVLSGNFSDEDGVYGPGDFLLREPNDRHTPVATRDAECICLTAQEGPLQFTGRLFGLLNPLLRIGYNH